MGLLQTGQSIVHSRLDAIARQLAHRAVLKEVQIDQRQTVVQYAKSSVERLKQLATPTLVLIMTLREGKTYLEHKRRFRHPPSMPR